MSQTTLLLIRHGETDANASGTWQGSTDSPLNERGHTQARAVAEFLASENHAVNTIYSSPLSRAKQTAEIIAQRLGHPALDLDPDLAEFHMGDWEGLTYQALRFEKRLWDKMGEDPDFRPPNGESAVEFPTRLVRSIHTISAGHPGETTIIVSHGGAMATALAMLVDRDGQAWQQYQMANCALSELVFDPAPRLVRLNETKHLEGIGALERW